MAVCGPETERIEDDDEEDSTSDDKDSMGVLVGRRFSFRFFDRRFWSPEVGEDSMFVCFCGRYLTAADKTSGYQCQHALKPHGALLDPRFDSGMQITSNVCLDCWMFGLWENTIQLISDLQDN